MDSKFGKKRPITTLALTAFINGFMIVQKVAFFFLVYRSFQDILQSDSFFFFSNFLVLLSTYCEMLPYAI